ncbi:LysE family translocator [Oceanimonas pelagia]|uniref:LysE family translocator n=1 Tax=Oceanimonas pelagia TaxID=3028314 RepID=A0AA50KMJ5_9GAMM|nr:LysE family translocator [Oceanimonas pelagia]WMC09843.1 LysE family translocator [Oceanimonas pelagia]
MTLIDAFLFLPIAQLISLTPGPNNFLSMRIGVQSGMMAAVVSATGRVVGFGFLILLTAMGLGAMLASSYIAFTIIKWLGAAYLVYLGFKAWNSRTVGQSESPVYDNAKTNCKRSLTLSEYAALAKQDFLIAISNPKAILLFSSVFPQFIDPTTLVNNQFMVLGTLYLMTEYSAAAMYALFGMSIVRFVKTSRGVMHINRATGGMFICAGVLLASSSNS